MSEPRILVVRLGSLGDIVHAFPAVSALRYSFPDAQIIWVNIHIWNVFLNAYLQLLMFQQGVSLGDSDADR